MFSAIMERMLNAARKASQADRRFVFFFHDGEKTRAECPWELCVKLNDALPDYANVLRTMARTPGSADGQIDRYRLIKAARQVFGIGELQADPDGQAKGLGPMEVLSVFAAFMSFITGNAVGMAAYTDHVTNQLQEARRRLPASGAATGASHG